MKFFKIQIQPKSELENVVAGGSLFMHLNSGVEVPGSRPASPTITILRASGDRKLEKENINLYFLYKRIHNNTLIFETLKFISDFAKKCRANLGFYKCCGVG